jgi:hypothetical protein
MSGTVTPYGAAKIVNAQLAELNINKKLPPQMMYTYASKGYIPSTKIDNKIQIDKDELAKWFVEYVQRNHKIENNNIEDDNNIDKDQLTLDI